MQRTIEVDQLTIRATLMVGAGEVAVSAGGRSPCGFPGRSGTFEATASGQAGTRGRESSPGQGSTFSITLPLIVEKQVAPI